MKRFVNQSECFVEQYGSLIEPDTKLHVSWNYYLQSLITDLLQYCAVSQIMQICCQKHCYS